MARMLALCTLLFATATVCTAYSGDGTAYSGCGEHDKTGKNACGFGRDQLSGRTDCYYAALPTGCGDKSGGCGECAKVCGAAGCVTVKVIDQCASCSCGDIDLSKSALKAATGYEWDRKPVDWEWAPCGGDDSESSSRQSSDEEEEKKDSKKDDKRNNDDDDDDDDDDDEEEEEESDRKRKNKNNDRRLKL